ncbi:putative transmembrane protein [Sesbania bispinosa]|nr:putative transmembrane protein [Sesbania bispinosa]
MPRNNRAGEKTETTPYCSEKLVICNSEVGEKSSPVFEETETVTAVTETTTATCCTTVTTIGDNVSEKKCYRRVQSERRVVVAPGREFKRFNTGQFQRPLRYVEQLSKDEFNRAVEDFIAKHKRMQWEEQIGSQNTEYLTVTQ